MVDRQARKRLAVVGAGLIGTRHIDIIARSNDAQLAAVVDPVAAAAATAKSHGVPWFADLRTMLADDIADGVVVASPNQLHVEHGLQCVEAGLPVLIEKPIDSDARRARRLVDHAGALGVPVLVGHHRRHNPIVKAAKERLDAGAIGTIVAASGMCWLYKPDDYFNVEWRTKQGAGPVFINLIHDVDLLRYFCGEVQSVQAVQSNRTRGHEVEDTAAIILQFCSGTLATISVSDTIVSPWSWELTAGENAAYPNTQEACYLLGGSHGAMEIPSGRIWSNPGKRSWWEPIGHDDYDVTSDDPLDAQISHFCRVIAGQEKPLVSGEEGLRTLLVIEAIKQSAQEAVPITVSSTPERSSEF